MLTYFYSFENREGIFPDIDSRYKFALMQILSCPSPKNHTIQTMSYLTEADSLYTQKPLSLTLQDLTTLSPTQLSLPEVRSEATLKILLKLYSSFSLLSLARRIGCR